MIATTPSVDAELPQHGDVLARLRHHAVVRRDAQQEQVDPGRPRDHRPHEPLVAGHVHHREPAATRQLERRVAELDRDAALALLGEAVGLASLSALR